ncbi:UTP--GlnB (protein PII) uridylyltransferase GlnD [Mesocricetibacter intestinalis]|uniref:Bifunctional uridylyltransferase/uridylyl-removing enzyme n=1 Tax=Mesocricetibacter intestinalis TaxID=1521930 RepID=A0A4V3D9N0_9PAST|nr:bifunctional uridylyltransferase/uridylyl-removing protein GlnD [Mesocricetibacter intestinalis]TDQ57138.1 UTP--GlnB (protein PII) uridylyltransferase GlnD [Mesocricetibacter intestinalis]
MLFSYNSLAEPTPSAVKLQKDALKRNELENFSHTDINALIANRTLFCDRLLIELWHFFGLEREGLTLVAVGGYGRQEMFPLSDLDFLILTRAPVTEHRAQKISRFVQFLWDCGFDVGHAVRTLADCEREGKKDISIATNLLESRYLSGDKNLFAELSLLLRQQEFWPASAFFQAKTAEQRERYQRYNNTGYNLEPDIKYSPGGLRDLHLVYWLALRHSEAKNLRQILDSGFIYPEEFELLEQCRDFLFKVRFALHLILKRYDNRLLFDRQLKVSQLLGYRGEGNSGVEAMMKAFFQCLQDISTCSDILVKHYQEHFLAASTSAQTITLDQCFIAIDNEIRLLDPYCFQRRPDSMLDLFYHLTCYPDMGIHSSVLRRLHLAVKAFRGYLSDIPTAREKFIRLFAQPKAIERAFVPMHKYGVLNVYLPQWQGIKGLMQFDLFHTYTVDEHILRVMMKLESFAGGDNQISALCTDIFSRLSDRTLLYIAALFHDIAKGRGGDHARLGARDVRSFAEQHGFDRREAETMAWLVEQHLLMSVTAQRRDIYDPGVVRAFAEQVCNKVRLDYLICLTVADISATNETLWNSWKRSLLESLYQYSEQQFRRGMDNLLDQGEKIEDNCRRAEALLREREGDEIMQRVHHLWRNYPQDYFLRNNPKQLAWHTAEILRAEQPLLVRVSNRFSRGGTEIFVYCRDQSHLFHKLVCAIGARKFSIHDAQIMTTAEGYALDSFIVTELNGELLQKDRRRLLEQSLLRTLSENNMPNPVLSINPKLENFQVGTEVRFLHMNKREHTELELIALDKTGLLATVSRVFCDLSLNLLNAKITTVGEKAEDFFILTNKKGVALDAAERTLLEQRLRDALA